MIKIGFERESGIPVEVGLMHSVISGITRSGKSETTHAMIKRVENTRFLIFDVKDPRDYQGVGVDVPIYIQEKTDPLMLKRLLESQSHLSLKFEFPELIKVCKHEDTWNGVLDGINQSLREGIHPIVENKLLVLQHLLTKLVNELEKTPIVDRLELRDRVNVVDLSKVSRELQQLAVYSSLRWVLEKERDLVVVLDEAHRFVPEEGSNASKEVVIQLIREGGAKGIWCWIVDQTITGVDKQVLKQCWIWVLGKQRELNEAKRTLQQVPFKTGLNERDIMRLGVGHFIVCTDQFAKIVYVWPSWLPEDVAVKVARGEVSVEEVVNFKFQLLREDEELVWKEKYEGLLRDFEKRVEEERQKAFREAMKKVDETKKQLNVEEYQRTIAELKEENSNLKKAYEATVEQLKKASSDLEAFAKVREGLMSLLPTPATMSPVSDVPSDVVVSRDIPEVTVAFRKPKVEADENSWRGRLFCLLADGFFDESRRLTPIRERLQKDYGSMPNAALISNELVELVKMHLLKREQEGGQWVYMIHPGAKERVRTKEINA